VRAILSSWQGKIGLILTGAFVFLALFGPVFAPHSPSEIVGRSFAAPSSTALLGTDMLGRDVLSRFLSGGASLLTVAVVSTLLCYPLGVLVGMLAAYLRGPTDLALVWASDVLLSIPAIVLALLVVAGLGPGVGPLVIAIAIVQFPQVVRLARTAGVEVSVNPFVESAVARGESSIAIATREIFPNIRGTLLTDLGLRICFAIIIFSSLSFLGLGQAPPAAEWGLMISENRDGLLVQPLAIAVPALAIALLTIGINLLVDTFARALGRTVVQTGA
jgi:peptide/nickel transport system permease protein